MALPDLQDFSTVWLPQGQWTDLLTFLVQRFPGVSANQWHQRMLQGKVQDSKGQTLGPQSPYCPLQHLRYWREPGQEPNVPFEAQVLFEDEAIVVADKPHFLPVTPGGAYLHNTLQNRLRSQLSCPDLQVVHRLDRETAGLVLLVKNPVHRAPYHALFAQRQVLKRYLAIAALPPAHLALPLRHESRLVPSGQFFLQKENHGPANSMTEIAMCHTLPGQRALYALAPLTGRKHQLRVHMASLGCPIEGDRFYPMAQQPDLQDISSPLQLLAHTLAFTDPITGADRTFQTRQVLDGVNSHPD